MRDEGRLRLGPRDSGRPLGYWCFLSDPDRHTVELSYGQEVGLTSSIPPDRDTLTIRSARAADAADLFPIVAEFATSFVPERSAFGRALPRILSDQNACLLVAELDGRVTGYLLGFEHLTFFANGPVSWVEEIAVTASLRGTGIGRALMTRFEQWAASRGSRLVALATRRAAGFYSELGYQESASYFRRML